jgi:hypothetical protein
VASAAVHRICEDSGVDRQLVQKFRKLGVACILSRPMQQICGDDDEEEPRNEVICSKDEQEQCRFADPSDEDQLVCNHAEPHDEETETGIADQLLVLLKDSLVRELHEDASAIFDFIHAAFQGLEDNNESLHEALQGVVSMLIDCGAPESARELLLWWQALSACSGGDAEANLELHDFGSGLTKHDAMVVEPVSTTDDSQGEAAEPLQFKRRFRPRGGKSGMTRAWQREAERRTLHQ